MTNRASDEQTTQAHPSPGQAGSDSTGAAPAPTVWSWKKALGHAGLVLLAGLIVGGVTSVAFAPEGADMNKLGEAVGRLLAFTAVAGFGTSFAFQTQRKGLGIGLAALTGVLVFAMPIIALVASPSDRPTLEGSARVEFEMNGSRLVHPHLGLSFDAPPAGHEAVHDLAKTLLSGPATESWAWADRSRGGMWLIAISREDAIPTPTELESVMRGAWEGFTKAARSRNLEVTDGKTIAPTRRMGTFGPLTLGMRVMALQVDGRHYTSLMAVLASKEAIVRAGLDSLRGP